MTIPRHAPAYTPVDYDHYRGLARQARRETFAAVFPALRTSLTRLFHWVRSTISHAPRARQSEAL
jgi:hypothetical protein